MENDNEPMEVVNGDIAAHSENDSCYFILKNQENIEKFVCKQCNKEFDKSNSVKQHFSSVHKAQKRPLSPLQENGSIQNKS